MNCPKCKSCGNEHGAYRGGNVIHCTKCGEDYGMESVMIGNRWIGDGFPCYLIGEIGINHNGDINVAKHLIDIVAQAGWDAVKFQKRTIDVVYTKEELSKPRENPFGPTNGDLKRGLEFGIKQYMEIDHYCRQKGITWFASGWDELSVDFIAQFDIPCLKIASASLTDDALLRHVRSKGIPIILSTGMSTSDEVDHAINILGKSNLILLHTCSTYPSDYKDLNLRVIPTLKERYKIPIGYSGHETGLPTSIAAVAMGANVIERHVTLDRAMWGTDQAASLSPSGIIQLARDIRLVEESFGTGTKRLLDSEIPVKAKLRRK